MVGEMVIQSIFLWNLWCRNVMIHTELWERIRPAEGNPCCTAVCKSTPRKLAVGNTEIIFVVCVWVALNCFHLFFPILFFLFFRQGC